MQHNPPRRRSRTRYAAAGITAAALGGMFLINRANARKAERDHPPLGSFADIDGVRLHYLERGTGSPIVLLHGNGTMVEDWIVSGLLDDLAATHRVIAIDRPGFGHSSRPRGTLWTAQRQADVVAGLLRRLDISAAVVVGHSFGTLVAGALALNHRDLVSGVVLMGGYFYPVPRLDVLMAVPSATPGLGDVLGNTVTPLMARAMEPMSNKVLFGPAPVTAGWRDAFPMSLTLKPSRLRAGAADAVQMVPTAATLAPRWGELDMPVTVIAGDGDRLVDPTAQSQRLHEALPDSRIVMLQGVGHMAHHSDMPAVAGAVRAA